MARYTGPVCRICRRHGMQRFLKRQRWLDLDMAGLRGRVLAAPGREDIDTQVNEQLVVEFYSR